MTKLLIVCSFVALAHTVKADDPFRLVDGDVEAVIVGDDTMRSCVENGYKNVPHFLATYIEQSTGRALKNIKEADYNPDAHRYAIFLGDTKAAKQRHGDVLASIDRDGYIVEVTSGAVYLIGARRHSTYYAMADFLYSAMGIATYIPSKWGTIVPPHESVVLKPSYRLEVPAFTSRAFSNLRTYHDDGERFNYNGNADIPWRIYRRDKFHHAIQTFITVEEFGESNPEFFPERNGKRLIVSKSTGPGPCISNPEVVQIVIDKARAYFDEPKNVDVDSISLGMTDGGWCECAQCQALDGPDIIGNENAKSRRYYWFLNQVGDALRQTHPDKSIGVLAYAGADWPPADFPVARNITPYICQTRACWGDVDVKRRHLAQAMAWADRVDRIGTYEYLYGAGYSVPRLYHQHLAEYLRTVLKTGGGGFYAEIYSNHAMDGPKAWVSERLLWNPFKDPAALQTLWCQRVFEEAAEPMDAYFALLERLNSENITSAPHGRKGRDSKFWGYNDEIQFHVFTPQNMNLARSHLVQAKAATDRPEILERIDYFERGFTVAELCVRAFHAYNPAKQLAAEGASPKQILAALIAGEADGPTQDPLFVLQQLREQDSSSFSAEAPIAISTATELSMQLVNGRPWDAVYDMIQQGAAQRESLAQAAKTQLLAIAPADWQSDPLAKRRIEMLLAMCDRVVVAPPTDQPPTIDGDLSDPAWQWQVDSPWWQWKSGIPYKDKTELAFCYHGDTLYVAARCHQDDIAQRRKSDPAYGVSGWKFVSMELHMHPDERDASADDVPRFQGIPTLGGGMWANQHDVVKQWKVTHGDDHWQYEMEIDLAKLNMSPKDYKALRINLIRNTKEHGHYGKGWFPSSMGHNAYHARGWLVFGK